MRRSFTLCSILVHAAVIAGALVTQVLAVGELPTPHQPPLSFATPTITLVDIQLPAAPRRTPVAATDAPRLSASVAPLVAPAAVTPETGPAGAPGPSSAGPIVGVASALPSAMEDLGVATVVPPAPPPPSPMHLHAGIKPPKKIADAAPVYPALARAAQVQGVVILEAVIDAQGAVASVRVLRSIPLLDQAAITAVEHWRFTPTLLNGQPVPVVMTVTVQFTLEGR
jgi:protein TonB